MEDKFILFARKNRIKHIEIDVLAMNNEKKDADFWSSYMHNMFSDKQVLALLKQNFIFYFKFRGFSSTGVIHREKHLLF